MFCQPPCQDTRVLAAAPFAHEQKCSRSFLHRSSLRRPFLIYQNCVYRFRPCFGRSHFYARARVCLFRCYGIDCGGVGIMRSNLLKSEESGCFRSLRRCRQCRFIFCVFALWYYGREVSLRPHMYLGGCYPAAFAAGRFTTDRRCGRWRRLWLRVRWRRCLSLRLPWRDSRHWWSRRCCRWRRAVSSGSHPACRCRSATWGT